MNPNIPPSFYRVSIKALILSEDKKKFLVGHAKNGKWLLLGGGMDWGETVEECLSRELKEEAGLEISVLNLNPAYTIPGQRDNGDWAINMVHEVIIKNLDFTPTDECTEIKFVSAAEAKELTSYKAFQQFAQVFDSTLHKRFRKSSKSDFS